MLTPLVAIVGNPNAGKTSLFNALTGSHQRVGNYPGVTVERIDGSYTFEGQTFGCVDIPGLYSLTSMSADEEIASKEIVDGFEGRIADLMVYVLDATNLERNLYFFSQVRDLKRPMICALTMSDLLEKNGVVVNLEALEQELGVPVVAIVSHKGKGLSQLKMEIRETLANSIGPQPTFGSIAERYQWAESVRSKCLVDNPAKKWRARSDKVDKILTHRVWGLGIFLVVMALMFQSIYTLAKPMMDLVQLAFDWLGTVVGAPLEGTPWLQSLVVDGVIAGIGSIAVFLPQILIMFFFIAALEGSGYLARASFLMDRLMGWCGLNGKAFIPLLGSFACAIPGIMAARIMPDSRSRLATILVAPLMSCSARLPVYVLLIGAIIEPRYGPIVAGLTLFGMHAIGPLIAIPVIWILNRKLLKGKRLPFLLELPPYQWPKWRDMVKSMLGRARVFVQTAGTVIFAMSVMIWALLYFPQTTVTEAQFRQNQSGASFESYAQQQQIENSFLGQIGKGIEPVFRPAGFDWRISTAILASFPAREVFVSSLGIIMGLGNEQDESSQDLRLSLQQARKPDGTQLMSDKTTFGLMVFFALCCQCGSTLAAIRKETNSWKWPVFVFSYMTILAWIFAALINSLPINQ